MPKGFIKRRSVNTPMPFKGRVHILFGMPKGFIKRRSVNTPMPFKGRVHIWNAKGFYQETECKHPNALQGASTHFIQHVYCDCACLVGTHTVHVRALEFAQTDVSVPCSQMFVTRDN